MKNARLHGFVSFVPRASVKLAGSLGLTVLVSFSAMAQNANPPKDKDKDKVKDNYIIHQSFDLGGHVENLNGSPAMYDTLVNLQSGPRVLNHTLEMHATEGSKHLLFDTLFEDSTGYGGDPNAFSTLRASKGKIYDFVGTFRRDRQYFDYNLWGNPLMPGGAAAAVSNGYVFPQIQDSTHYFNTVRRNTDLNFTFLPLSKIRFRAGYNLNIMQGPTQSSIHQGSDALLLQNWRNSTQTWLGGVDWKPVHGTTLTYEEHVTTYKGDTNWQLAGLNMQLPNGAPVTLGFDNATGVGAVSASTGCSVDKGRPAVLNATTNPPTANPCVNGFTSYSRFQPTRVLFPTEEFRFQSSSIKTVQMTGRFLYTGANMKLPNYNEAFTGMESRVLVPISVQATAAPAPAAYCTSAANTATRQTTYNDCHTGLTMTGNAKAQRINVSADYGIVWQLGKAFSISDQYDFQNWRQPAIGTFSEVDQYAASMIAPTAVTTAPAITAPVNSLSQKMQTNTLIGEWEASAWLQLSLGYRYRTRTFALTRSIPTEAVLTPAALSYSMDIHENSGLFDIVLRPTRDWRINSSVEIGWDDAVYVQTNPRQFQRYKVHATYQARKWATLSGAFNDTERRDNATLVHYLAHDRGISGTASLAPNEKFALDLNYGYIDVFSTLVDCFDASVAPAGATAMPIGVACGNAVNTATSTAAFYGNSYYDAPTQYGSAAVVVTPIKPFRAGVGYRVNSVQGNTQLLNPLAALGTLQSKYHSPYVNLAYTFSPAWTVKADYNYYGYGEENAFGPTSPRNFHSNIYTLGMHYQF